MCKADYPPKIRECGHCGKILEPYEKHRGDMEFDEWLCNDCWDELGFMSRNNQAIIREIAREYHI